MKSGTRLAVLLAIVAVLIVFSIIPEDDRGKALYALWPVVGIVVGLLVVVAVIAAGVRMGVRPNPTQLQPIQHTAAFPVIPIESHGHFKITGVDRETKMDTTWYCDAESEANARVKAELEGIVVTGIEWAATTPSEPEPKREPFKPTRRR